MAGGAPLARGVLAIGGKAEANVGGRPARAGGASLQQANPCVNLAADYGRGDMLPSRAGGIMAQEVVEDGTVTRVVGVFFYLGTILALVFFGVWEVLDWLRTASWPGRSIATLYPVIWDTGWEGVDVILTNVWKSWIGLPIFAVGMVMGWVCISEAEREDQRARLSRHQQ